MTDEQFTQLQIELREKDTPYYSREELEYFFNKHGGNIKNILYECLLIKAENTTLTISGMSTSDTSRYFKMLAQKYRPNHSGNIL